MVGEIDSAFPVRLEECNSINCSSACELDCQPPIKKKHFTLSFESDETKDLTTDQLQRLV